MSVKQFLKRCYRGIRPNQYRPQEYWARRHRDHLGNLRAVGNIGLTEDENAAMYAQARTTFLELCQQARIDFPTARVLDIGCGIGFYTEVMSGQGVPEYLGIDISDVQLPPLRERFPTYRFQQLDICQQTVTGIYDLIVMIDVEQHIISEEPFSSAMRNLKNALSPGGVIVLTSELPDRFTVQCAHVVARPLSHFKREFPDFTFSTPQPFRDKYIWTISATPTANRPHSSAARG